MAMCVIAVEGAAPCQGFSPGANRTTSPGRISSTRRDKPELGPGPAGKGEVAVLDYYHG